MAVIVLLLGLGLTALQAQTMYLKSKSGMQTAYSLRDIKKMTFSSGNLVVTKTTGSQHTYALNGFRYLNFENLTTDIVTAGKKDVATLLLYPNPALEVLNIQFSDEQQHAFIIEIFSIEGRVVYREKLNPHSHVHQINVSALPKGFYLCKLNNGITKQTAQFLKQ